MDKTTILYDNFVIGYKTGEDEGILKERLEISKRKKEYVDESKECKRCGTTKKGTDDQHI